VCVVWELKSLFFFSLPSWPLSHTPLRAQWVSSLPPALQVRAHMPGGATYPVPPRDREGNSPPPPAFDLFVVLTFAVFLVILVALGRWVVA
jgi:hypothetical protein